ncbi:LuxR C-terminal-related transcriptional regulator [Geodermatophilus sabuli]|uniref:LuxR C-terminal-related transcriptional regulator n=1 Tax=Geodermatophilus sabuli TaxID=1564158 RepID=UPI00117B23A1|nr:LuxR C-terminal-related transcriptional regulator [Geodermatophilus sabuli]MBB3082361.1 DNA-binding CsgD family transcriptional regulator [Geodermatophilus sabuli]
MAQSSVVDALSNPSLTQAERGYLSAVLVQLGQSRTALREADTARRMTALPSVRAAMDRLRSATSIAALLERAPGEVAKVGYDRCLVSRVHDGRWVAESAFVKDDAEFAEAITAAGRQSPRRIDQTLLESELVRRRKPLLVTDPQRNPRVHRELITVTGTQAYVAAPVVVGRTVLAFVHADESRYSGLADEFDREVIGMLTECLGLAAERAAYHERLQLIRRTMADSAALVVDFVDEMVETSLEAAPTPLGRVEDDCTAPAAFRARSSPPSCLTIREREVLELMAAGDTNVRIASSLFITEATVKAHVKHIFRKLGVANRAEAVSRYLRS